MSSVWVPFELTNFLNNQQTTPVINHRINVFKILTLVTVLSAVVVSVLPLFLNSSVGNMPFGACFFTDKNYFTIRHVYFTLLFVLAIAAYVRFWCQGN